MSQAEQKDKEKKSGKIAKGSAKFLGYGLVGLFLAVWIFALGVLTGRGDMHRLFQRLGLYKNDLAVRLGVTPEAQVPVSLPLAQSQEATPAAPEQPGKPAAEAKAAGITPATPAPAPEAAKPPADSGKKPAAASHEAKKGKAPHPAKPDAASIASKLSFQNSLDAPVKKPLKAPAKKEGAVHTASIAPTPSQAAPGAEKKPAASAYQVKLGTYKTAEEAQKALADLKKKGFPVSIQPGKDKTGATYMIKTGRYTSKAEAEKVAQKLKAANISGQIQEVKR